MPLQAPDLDDRRYADIVDEARALIPRYCPEWTDLNDSDPGIQLVKLFAWMTDLTLYRVNRIPERAHVEFLRMVGIELKPATPAIGEVSFTPARLDIAETPIPAGLKIAARADEEGPVIFETTRAASVIGATLVAVQSFDGFAHANETVKAANGGQWFHPFGPAAREGCALLLGLRSQVDLTSGTIDLAVIMAGGDRTPPPALVGRLPAPAPARLVWEAFDLTGWQRLQIVSDDTLAFTRSGHVILRGPGPMARRGLAGDVREPLFWLRCRIEEAAYERAPRLDAVLINTVPVAQTETVLDEVLGASDGRPDQGFTLSRRPVAPAERPERAAGPGGAAVTIGSVRIEVDEGQGFLPWEEREDFHASGPDDPHFVVNRTAGTIRFGDGRNGRIPLAFATPFGANIVARRYRAGGGRRGNLPAGAVTEIQGYLPGVERAANQRPTFGGAREETVAEAKLRAAAVIRSNGRAVTAEDFELAASEAGARRAKALARTHPRYPGVDVPGAVTVLVVPDGDGPAPMPNEMTLASVAAAIERKRLITTEVHVAAPLYRDVRIEAGIEAEPTADVAAVRNAVEARLLGFFHPLTGGPDGLGWPFGGPIFYSDVYRMILGVPGVSRISDGELAIILDGEAQAPCRDVFLCRGELATSVGHGVNVLFRAGGR